ncbi:MAG: NAD(P)H-dependent oxidoreductase subunit E, partial [Candidatus Omnitrophica bacterium]|nr:NAD(P)H-dependent oxidoreductase subunit E [Candidatus Omnitrophota bacterium]
MGEIKLDELQPEAEAILARYEQKRAAMLPLLRLIQEHLGFIG